MRGPSRDELLNSIKPGIKLNKAFFMRIYGYEITWPGFAEEALAKLEEAGSSKARGYYEQFVKEYQEKRKQELKEVARWYAEKSDKSDTLKKKGREETRERQEDSSSSLQQKSYWQQRQKNLELLAKLRNLL